MSLDVVFAYVVGVRAGLAVIGALVVALVWEWCAIRHTLAAHRHRAPEGFWRDRGALPAISPAEDEPIRDGARRLLAGQSLQELALGWKGHGRHGRRRP
jgi:hypothetical protein